jgi:hypothetical protein
LILFWNRVAIFLSYALSKKDLIFRSIAPFKAARTDRQGGRREEGGGRRCEGETGVEF